MMRSVCVAISDGDVSPTVVLKGARFVYSAGRGRPDSNPATRLMVPEGRVVLDQPFGVAHTVAVHLCYASGYGTQAFRTPNM